MAQIPGTYEIPYAATCLSCGYALRGLTSHTCPECGREFDPAKPWTMQFPGAPHAKTWRAMEPLTAWTLRKIRRLVVVLVLLSAWFPLPFPLPVVLLVLVRSVVLGRYRRRAENRERLIGFYQLSTESRGMDEVDVGKLRKAFSVGLLLSIFHIPFVTAFAVSYPLLARSAHYWWAVAPSTQNPPKHWTIRGVFLVRIEADTRGVKFRLPVGYIRFAPDQGTGGLTPDFVSGFE